MEMFWFHILRKQNLKKEIKIINFKYIKLLMDNGRNKEILVLFDVDGTLTKPRNTID
jgi:hypothetical protein